MALKGRCSRVLIITAFIVVLTINAGLLVSIFLSKNFAVVIFTSLIMTVIGLAATFLICLPMLDSLFSPLMSVLNKMKDFASTHGIPVAEDEAVFIDQAYSQMKRSLDDFARSNSYLQKFVDSVFKASAFGDIAKAADDGVRAVKENIDAALLLLISQDRTKATVYPLFPEDICEKTDYVLGAGGIELRTLRIKTSYQRRDLSGQLNTNMLENVFSGKEYRSSIMVPIVSEGLFLGIIGAAVKEGDPRALKAAIHPLESVAGLLAVKLAYFKSSAKLSQTEERLIDFKHVEKKKIEDQMKELKEAYNQVVQASKMASLGQLSAGVAHELNNPIGGILGYIQLVLNKLKSSSPSQEAIATSVRYLEMVEKESKRCQWIISNLLNFSRKPDQEMVPVNVQDVIENTISMLEYQMSQKNVKVSVSFPPEGLKPVKGNGNQLQQVFTNLVTNAQDAMLEGGTVKIVGLNKQDTRYRTPFEYVEVSVSDTGHGISKENITKIFDPFFTSKIGKSGTGLGLSITHTIINAHKGTIRVESEEGKGTTFIVSLPAFKEAKSA